MNANKILDKTYHCDGCVNEDSCRFAHYVDFCVKCKHFDYGDCPKISTTLCEFFCTAPDTEDCFEEEDD